MRKNVILLLCVGLVVAGMGLGCSHSSGSHQPSLVSMALSPTGPNLAKGRTEQFTATATYSDGSTKDVTIEVAWASSNPALARVSSTGLVETVDLGTLEITATLSSISVFSVITVLPALLDLIEVTPTTPSIADGTLLQLTATGVFSDGVKQDVTALATWSPSAPAVATVSDGVGSKGLVTTFGPGDTSASAQFAGVTGSTTLTVTSATLVSIAVTPTQPSLSETSTLQLIATGTFSNG